jgi:hypothetical protein
VMEESFDRYFALVHAQIGRIVQILCAFHQFSKFPDDIFNELYLLANTEYPDALNRLFYWFRGQKHSRPRPVPFLPKLENSRYSWILY